MPKEAELKRFGGSLFTKFLEICLEKTLIQYLPGIRDQGPGIRNHGSWIMDQGPGNREQGSGYREQETVNWELKTEN